MSPQPPSPDPEAGGTEPRHILERKLLLEVSQAVSSTLDLLEVLQIIADGTAQLVGVETAAVYTVEGDQLFLGATTPPLAPHLPEDFRWAARADHPHIARAIDSKQPVMLADASRTDLSPAERIVVEERRLRSLLFLPFCLDGEAIGVLILGTTNHEHVFDQHEIDLCRTLTNQLAVGVQNARLHTGLKNYAAELEKQMAEQARLAEELRHAQKMEAVGQLAGGVAHDFNNLLQVIRGFSDIARREVAAGSAAAESLEVVCQAADRATTLVQKLLAFGRRQVLSLEALDLIQVVEELLPMLRPLMGEHITIECEHGANIGRVSADRNQIEQILINLCINARDAMPSGGTLCISSESVTVDEPQRHTLGLPNAGAYVLLEVKDTGHGMDARTRERAFEPFFTTKEPGRGTGLGLASVHGLVAQHRGAVQMASEIGRGTSVRVYLPATRSTGRVAVSPEEAAPRNGSETILLAEDEEMVLQLSQSMLEGAGYTVLSAGDGDQALQLVAEHGHEIDLAVLDLVMPKQSGEVVFRSLRARRPGVPVLFASAYSPVACELDLDPADGVELIQKPFSKDDLLHRVRHLLDDAPQS